MFAWGISPKILWVTPWVTSRHVSKPEVERSPNKNLGRGQSSRYCFLHCVSFVGVRCIFPWWNFSIWNSPVRSKFLESGGSHPPSWKVRFSLGYRNFPLVLTIPIRKCHICQTASEDRRGSDDRYFSEFSEESMFRQDEFKLGTSFWFGW